LAAKCDRKTRRLLARSPKACSRNCGSINSFLALAVGDDGSIYSIDLNEASLNAKMLARSAERVLLADTSKFGRSATFAVAPICSVNHVISDLALTVEWRQRLLNLGVDLKIAGDGRERSR
jgi:DeoR/GlpR family transcriptional regulator of sugar metabolism